jgi:ribonucleoside-diphosphate reductase alpha chain
MTTAWDKLNKYLVETRYAIRDPKTSEPIEHSYEEVTNRIITELKKIDTEIIPATEFDNIIQGLRDKYIIAATPFMLSFGNPYTKRKGYFSCFPLGPVEDSMQGIGHSCKEMENIYIRGGGAGIDVSNLRPKGAPIDNKQGISSGPVTFLDKFNSVTGTTNQGGRRRGALLVQMDYTHPDVKEFIKAKYLAAEMAQFISTLPEDVRPAQNPILSNMNLSLNIDEKFFSSDIVDLVAENMWKTGDPGLLFVDNMLKYSPFKGEDEPRYSNPCVVGSTFLRTPMGDYKIKDIVTLGIKKLPVYCCDPKTGKLAIRIGRNPRITGKNKKVYKVTYSKGRGESDKGFIIVNNNHKFLTSDLKEIKCRDLEVGTRLKFFSKGIHNSGSKGKKENNFRTNEVILSSNNGENIKESHLVAEWKYDKEFNWGSAGDEDGVHHKDENHTNNHPKNIEVLINSEHLSQHMTGENNPRYGVKVSDLTKHRMRKASREWREDQRLYIQEICIWCKSPFETTEAKLNNFGSFCCDDCKLEFNDLQAEYREMERIDNTAHECPYCGNMVFTEAITCGSKQCLKEGYSSGSNYKGVSEDRKFAAIESTKSKALTLASSLIAEGFDISTPEKWTKYFRSKLKTFEGKKRTSSNIINKYFDSWEEFLIRAENFNHIVLSIEEYGKEDVYNITVDEFHTVAWNDLIFRNCGEFLSPKGNACNLLTVNVAKISRDIYDTMNTEGFNVNDFKKQFFKKVAIYSKSACFLGNLILTLDEGYPSESIKKTTQEFKPVGVGMSGFHTALILAYNGYVKYGELDAITFADQTQAALTTGTLLASSYLTEQFKISYKNIVYWSNHIKNLEASVGKYLDDNVFIDLHGTVNEFEGFYNCITTSQAPTGSVSQFLRNMDTGIEPYFSLEHTRKIRDFENKWEEFTLTPYYLQDIFDRNEQFKERVQSQTAMKLTPIQQVDMLAAFQRHVHTGISKTINCPESTTIEEIKDLILTCKDKRFKGLTIYRDNCRGNDTILSTKSSPKIDKLGVKRKGVTYTINGPVKTYLTINKDDQGFIRECFIQSGDTGTEINALHNTIGRLLSKGFRIHPDLLKPYISSISKIQIGGFHSCKDFRTNSLPQMIGLLLEKEAKTSDPKFENDIKLGLDLCPDCQKLTLEKVGGCRQCKACGYSAC